MYSTQAVLGKLVALQREELGSWSVVAQQL